MAHFLDAIHSGLVLLMDGAMGTQLRRAGLREGECAELWNVSRPEVVTAIHQSYVRAGAACLLTNTFQSNPLALQQHGLRHRLEDINRAAIELARSVTGPDLLVIADIGPLAAGTSDEDVARLVASLQGADALLLETCSDLEDLALLSRVCDKLEKKPPVLFSLTYRQTLNRQVKAYGGVAPEILARQAAAHRIVALGVNCGRDIGMEETIEIVHRYRSATDLPLFARPNAGTPVPSAGDALAYPRTPDAMAAFLPALLQAGARMIGGCCGTTAEHIAAFRKVLDSWKWV
jgi:5-methyltetrahydrofolate--homocysteine methyltransferase